MQSKEPKADSNPFLKGNKEEVWKSFLTKAKRISREEFNQKMKEAMELQKKSARPSANSQN
jgi:hypothetical protein